MKEKRATMNKLPVIAVFLLAAALPAGAAESNMPDGSQRALRRHPPVLDLPKEDVMPTEPIAEMIGSVQLSAEGKEVAFRQLRGIVVSVHNGTQYPLVVDGDKATASLTDAASICAQLKQIDRAACPENSPARKTGRTIAGVVLGAVTIGGYQASRDAVVQRRPVLKRYGCDEARREDETEVFGRRVVWPGTTRKGIIYFAARDSLQGAALKIPIRALFGPEEQAMLTLQL